MVYKWLNIVRPQIAFRTACDLCGAASRHSIGLCPACLDDLPVIPHPCPRCGISQAHAIPGPCGACQRQPPAFDSAFIPFAYAPPLSGYITGLKFRSRLAAARLLGELLIRALPADVPDRPDCLLPVPLHARRLRGRGFNQALEIARPVAKHLQLPLDTHSVIRCRDTRPQSDLDQAGRRRNLRGAFELRQALPWRHVAIVDDVVTTGNTVNAVAGLLRRHGVERIQIWAVARA
jgi:ComF family protein